MWIKNVRGTHLVLQGNEVIRFSMGWWKWWKGVQSACHGLSDGSGAITAAGRSGDRDWSCMAKCGQNGVLTFLVALAWWGKAVLRDGGDVDMDWENALEDFEFVLVGLLW